MSVSGFIQAGGQSSRMGTDKAWLRLGDRAAIELVVEALRPVVDQLAVVTNRPGYERLGLPLYADLVKDYGPLGGIHAALSHAGSDYSLVVACDLPFVRAELFETIIAARFGYQVVVPLDEGGRTQQLCALYSRDCLPAIAALLAEGVRAPRALFERVSTRRLGWAELADLPGAAHFFDNLNTPADYERARAAHAQLAPPR